LAPDAEASVAFGQSSPPAVAALRSVDDRLGALREAASRSSAAGVGWLHAVPVCGPGDGRLAACGGRIDNTVSTGDAGAASLYDGAAFDTPPCQTCPDPSSVSVRHFCSGNGCWCPSTDPPPPCGGPIQCACLDEVWACRDRPGAAWSSVYASECDQ